MADQSIPLQSTQERAVVVEEEKVSNIVVPKAEERPMLTDFELEKAIMGIKVVGDLANLDRFEPKLSSAHSEKKSED